MFDITLNRADPDGNVHKVLWEGMADGDTIQPLFPGRMQSALSSVQMTGTFGGTVVLQGSNDGVNWVTMKDTDGADISMSAAGLVELSSTVWAIRPSPGAGVSDVDVTMVLRG